MGSSQPPAVHCFLVVFALLCSGALAASSPARYHSASLDSVISSKFQAQYNCYDPADTRIPAAATSGNRLAIHPTCAGGSKQTARLRDIFVHDRARLSTVLQRSTSSDAMSMPPVPPIVFPPTSSAPTGPAPAEAPTATIPDHPDLETVEFVVTVGFGTPAQQATLIFDTGSDVSWTQCQPCTGHCYKQEDPLFDPSKSSTYAVVPCGSPTCALAGGSCNGTSCLYSVEYGDDSSTEGTLSQETLTFTSSRAFSTFVFGCGTTNLGDFGDVDGLLGLGRGKLSLPSQTVSTFGASFSYCLPSFNTTPGYLSIGKPAVTGKVQYTKMIKKTFYPSFYFVELVSINIGGYVLPVPSTVFTNAGTLLDSGTSLTYIPPQAYALLRDRFKFTMKGNKPAPAFGELDTCYDFAGQSAIFIPAVSLIFSDGAIFDLNFYGIMIFPDENQPAIGCLAFVSGKGFPFSIIGNTQQRSTEVIYDVGAERIGFVPNSC
uniref:Uncharacterized protein n=1 Tax=Avena sativa TaxID=4498 RepID=A0ACD5ZM92_AVESA